MTSQIEIKQTGKQFEIEQRRKEVAIMAAQGMTEIEMAEKLGVDNTTISKDIKALKLISQQFIYDITKSDFTYYYKNNLELVRYVLRKQVELAEQRHAIEDQDLRRAKLLSDIIQTVATLNEYYDGAKLMHMSPTVSVQHTARFGIRPGTPEPREKEPFESVESELDGLTADLELWKANLKEAAKNNSELDAEDAAGWMAEIEEQIQIVRKETPEERKKRIKKDGYFTDWFAHDERDRKVKTSKYFCAEKRSQS